MERMRTRSSSCLAITRGGGKAGPAGRQAAPLRRASGVTADRAIRKGLAKRRKEGGITREKAQHRAFPRGPPPQYYPGSNLLNFAVRMGSGEPG